MLDQGVLLLLPATIAEQYESSTSLLYVFDFFFFIWNGLFHHRRNKWQNIKVGLPSAYNRKPVLFVCLFERKSIYYQYQISISFIRISIQIVQMWAQIVYSRAQYQMVRIAIIVLNVLAALCFGITFICVGRIHLTSTSFTFYTLCLMHVSWNLCLTHVSCLAQSESFSSFSNGNLKATITLKDMSELIVLFFCTTWLIVQTRKMRRTVADISSGESSAITSRKHEAIKRSVFRRLDLIQAGLLSITPRVLALMYAIIRDLGKLEYVVPNLAWYALTNWIPFIIPVGSSVLFGDVFCDVLVRRRLYWWKSRSPNRALTVLMFRATCSQMNFPMIAAYRLEFVLPEMDPSDNECVYIFLFFLLPTFSCY